MHRFSLSMVVAVAALTLVACGDDDSASSTPSPTSTTAAAVTAAAPSDADAEAAAIAFAHADTPAETCALMSKGFQTFVIQQSGDPTKAAEEQTGTCESSIVKAFGELVDLTMTVKKITTMNEQKVVTVTDGKQPQDLYVVEQDGEALVNSIGEYHEAVG